MIEDLKVLKNIGSFTGLEFGLFRMKKGLSEENMLRMAEAAEQKFLSNESGFLGHAILKGQNGLYSDLTFAKTKNDAEMICGKWMNNEFTLKYLEFIDPETVDMSFWSRIK